MRRILSAETKACQIFFPDTGQAASDAKDLIKLQLFGNTVFFVAFRGCVHYPGKMCDSSAT
jgi:hypothetical protein